MPIDHGTISTSGPKQGALLEVHLPFTGPWSFWRLIDPSGRRGITGDTALQRLYDLRLTQQKAGKAIDLLPTLKKVEHSPT